VQMEAAAAGPADIDMTLWDDKVRTPAVRLARETLPALSEWGFGTSALFFGGFFLVLGLVPGAAVAYFTSTDLRTHVNPFEHHVEVYFSVIIVAASLPMFIASVPAGVSSQCSKLLDGLNELRPEFTVEQNQQVLDLEQYLLRANSGQGLGFVLGGIVVNPRMLKKVGAAVYLVLLPVGTYMVSMGGADGVSTVAV
jgi:hypothetical protein